MLPKIALPKYSVFERIRPEKMSEIQCETLCAVVYNDNSKRNTEQQATG